MSRLSRPVAADGRSGGASRSGRLAQLVEHLVYTERVGGSSPSPPTTTESKSMPAGKLRGPSFFRSLLAAVVLLALPASGARAMDFSLQTVSDGSCRAHCPRVIVAEGQISNSTPHEFVQFLRDNVGDRDMRTVVLPNFQGGYVIASMELAG